MKTQITRRGRLEVADVRQTNTGAWRGTAFDGREAVADTAEECRDLLSDSRESEIRRVAHEVLQQNIAELEAEERAA